VEWRTKEKAKGVVTVVELCLESKVGAAYLFRLPFFPRFTLEINGTCRECSKGGHAWAAIVCYGPGVRPLSSVSSLYSTVHFH